MIGKLKGFVDDMTDDQVILDVSGVGYAVQCSMRTLKALPADGSLASLLIETHVREDAIRLYGFADVHERESFRALHGHVQGVGAKVALSVLSTLSPDELADAVASNNVALITRTPGVGKKVAERIVAELQGKLAGGGNAQTVAPATAAAQEAVTALTNLGYPRDKASDAVYRAVAELGADNESPAIIRKALKLAIR